MGDVIQFEVKEDGKFNPIMKNACKVENRAQEFPQNSELNKDQSIALQVCIKAVAEAADSLNIHTPQELMAAAEQCFEWYLGKVKNA